MSTVKKLEAGSEVDSKCQKCKDVTNHTIAAMVGDTIVKVVCNVCGARHNYRPPQPEKTKSSQKKTSRASGKSVKQAKAEARFEELLAGREASEALAYSMTDIFHQGDLINHPKFGLGVVTGVIMPDKIEVTFRLEDKILICGTE